MYEGQPVRHNGEPTNIIAALFCRHTFRAGSFKLPFWFGGCFVPKFAKLLTHKIEKTTHQSFFLLQMMHSAHSTLTIATVYPTMVSICNR